MYLIFQLTLHCEYKEPYVYLKLSLFRVTFFTNALTFILWLLHATQDSCCHWVFERFFRRPLTPMWAVKCVITKLSSEEARPTFTVTWLLLDWWISPVETHQLVLSSMFHVCVCMLMPDVQYGIYLPSAATTKTCTLAVVMSSRLRLLIAASYNLFLCSYGNDTVFCQLGSSFQLRCVVQRSRSCW